MRLGAVVSLFRLSIWYATKGGTLLVTSRSNTSRRHLDKLLFTYGRIFVQIFVSATWFIFAPSSMQTFKIIWFSATSWGDKSCGGGKELHKYSSVHTKRFVALTCGLITRPVHRKWFIAVTCCSDVSPSVPTFIWEVHVLLFPYRWHYYLLSQWFWNCLFPSLFS